MNEASGFNPNSPEQQKPEIPEELLAAVNGYVDTIPVVSPDFLKSEMAARMISRRTEQYSRDMSDDEKKALVAQTQSSMNAEGVVEEMVQRLQDTGVIAKEAKDGAGFSVLYNSPEAISARQEASRTKVDKIKGSKFGKTVLKPVVTHTSEYVGFRTDQAKGIRRAAAKAQGKIFRRGESEAEQSEREQQNTLDPSNDTQGANNETTKTLRMPWTSVESEKNPAQPLSMQEIRREINSRIAEAQLADSTETFVSLDNRFRMEVMSEQLALLDDSEKEEFTEKFLAEFVDKSTDTEEDTAEPETTGVPERAPRRSSLSDRLVAARQAAATEAERQRQAEQAVADNAARTAIES